MINNVSDEVMNDAFTFPFRGAKSVKVYWKYFTETLNRPQDFLFPFTFLLLLLLTIECFHWYLFIYSSKYTVKLEVHFW